MMKLFMTAAAGLLLACAHGQAQELSLDARRMLSYGTTAVEVKVCDLPITSTEHTRMMDALARYSESQKELTPDVFTEAMKAAGSQIGSNRDAVCAEVGKQTVAELLADDEQGR